MHHSFLYDHSFTSKTEREIALSSLNQRHLNISRKNVQKSKPISPFPLSIVFPSNSSPLYLIITANTIPTKRDIHTIHFDAPLSLISTESVSEVISSVVIVSSTTTTVVLQSNSSSVVCKYQSSEVNKSKSSEDVVVAGSIVVVVVVVVDVDVDVVEKSVGAIVGSIVGAPVD